MAINLWKLGGQPTSYNPLPLGKAGSGAPFIKVSMGSFIIRFKAMSVGRGRLRIQDSQSVGINQLVTLTSIMTSYSFGLDRLTLSGSDSLYIADEDNKGDIIIQDIELVRKPLPKLTINGLSDNYTDWENGSFNSGGVKTESGTNIRLKSNILIDGGKEYTLNLDNSFVGLVVHHFWDGSGNYIKFEAIPLPSLPYKFITPNNAKFYNLRFQKVDVTALNTSDVPKAKLMLNLGSTSAPYEPKRGDRMVMPVPRKNLVQTDVSAWEQGNVGSSGQNISDLTRIRTLGYYNVRQGISHTVSCGALFEVDVTHYLNGVYVTSEGVWSSKATFITKGNQVRLKVRYKSNANIIPDTIVNSLLQLEEGTTATPYEPYSVQLNQKPKKLVPKKNLITQLFDYNSSGGTVTTTTVSSASGGNKMIIEEVKPNKTYTISKDRVGTRFRYFFFSTYPILNSTVAIGGGYIDSSTAHTFTTPSNARYVAIVVGQPSEFNWVQLEEGSVATPYEPYQLVLPKAKKGLAMDGVNNYIQLPSMTMDAIEVDCLIDGNNSATQLILDARTGLTEGWLQSGGSFGAGFSNVTAFKRGERTKIKAIANAPFTDDITIFARYTGNNQTKGTLYKVTCYLNNQIVAQYDFENPNNIVGDKIIPNAKNLIPNFEDSRWSLHPNFKILGKDALRLDATGGLQSSDIIIDITPNKSYLFNIATNGFVRNYDGGVFGVGSIMSQPSGMFTPKTDKLALRLFNNAMSGTLGFTKPQLYELDGREGTIYGKPAQENRTTKRTLYSYR